MFLYLVIADMISRGGRGFLFGIFAYRPRKLAPLAFAGAQCGGYAAFLEVLLLRFYFYGTVIVVRRALPCTRWWRCPRPLPGGASTPWTPHRYLPLFFIVLYLLQLSENHI